MSGGSTGRGFPYEASTVQEEPERDAEIRAEERGEDREPPLGRHSTCRRNPDSASEVANERKECQRADESPSLREGYALGFKGFPSLVLSMRPTLLSVLNALLGTLAPIAAPATSCHAVRLAL